MANEIEVEIVFKRSKKSTVAKQAESAAKTSGKKAGQKFGNEFNKNVTANVKGINGLLSSIRKNVLQLAGGFLAFRTITSAVSGAFNGLREFSRGIAEVNSILPKNQKLTEDSIQTFSRFAATFGSTSAAQAKAFYSIVSAGVKGTTNQLKTLSVANKAAVAGLVDINTASRALVSSVNAYRTSGLTAEEASDKLFVSVREGQTTFGELADFLGNASSIANSAGVSFAELTGTVAALTKNGIETSKATIAMRSVLSALVNPTQEATETAKAFGLSLTTIVKDSGGFAQALKLIAERTGGNSKVLAKLFGNIRGLSGILSIVNGDFKDFERILKEVQNGSGQTSEAFGEIKKSLDFDLKQITAEIKEFGTTLLLNAQGSIKAFTSGLREIRKLIGPPKEKTVLEIANEQSSKLALEINKVRDRLSNLTRIKVESFFAGKDIKAELEKELTSLTKQRAKLRKIIVSESKTTGDAEVSERKKTNDKLATLRAGQIQALQELNVQTLAGVQAFEDERTKIITEGFAARLEIANMAAQTEKERSDNRLLFKQMENEALAQLELQAAAQREQILDASASRSLGLATEKFLGIKSALESIGISAVQVGKILKTGFQNVIGNSFQAVGRAIAQGSNAFDAFKQAAKSAVADIASTFGDLFIKQGAGLLLTGAPNGAALIAIGAGLKVLSGFLGASGGAPAAGGGGGGGGGPAAVTTSSFAASDVEEPEVEERGPRNTFVFENFFDTDDTRQTIVDFVNEQTNENGGTFNNVKNV